MRPDNLDQEIRDKINVTEQMVVVAKSHIIENFQNNTSYLINSVLESQEINHHRCDSSDDYASYFSWYNATIEAIYGLISSGQVLPNSANFLEPDQSLMHSWQSGSSRGQMPINVRGIQATVYQSIRFKPSGVNENDFVLSNADIFMSKMETGALASHINSDLRECIFCFRFELYLACITMLGRAVEGAWMNFGYALAEKATTQAVKENLTKIMSSPNQSMSKKMKTALDTYKKKDEFGSLWDETKVYPRDLDDTFNWSDTVRDARNSIHWGENPAIPNNYEKIAIYLMGAIPNFKQMAIIIEACALSSERES